MQHTCNLTFDKQESRMPMAEFVILTPVHCLQNRLRPPAEELCKQPVTGHLRESKEVLAMISCGLRGNERHVQSPDSILLSSSCYNP